MVAAQREAACDSERRVIRSVATKLTPVRVDVGTDRGGEHQSADRVVQHK